MVVVVKATLQYENLSHSSATFTDCTLPKLSAATLTAPRFA